MEASSPLAALRPRPIAPSWVMGNFGRPAGIERSRSLFGSRLGGCRVESVLGFEPLIESSPTTTLVSESSPNFRIERTTYIPTPRRSLFTTFSFAGIEKASTLQIPSSPPPTERNRSIDCSPLPHKPASTRSLIESPAISPTTENPVIDIRSSPPPVEELIALATSSLQEVSRKTAIPERKKNGPLSRQSALRARSIVTFKNAGVPPASKLTFASRASTAPPLDLDEIFASSPEPKEKKARELGPAFIPVAPSFPKQKSLTPSNLFENDVDGSPVAPLSRKLGSRPRNKIRRTLSMFEHPEEAMSPQIRKQENKTMNSPFINAPGENPYLPFFTIKDDPLRRIDKSVLLDLIDGKYKDKYDEFVVIDCRFEYEYEGGHVAGAINVNTINGLEERFFKNLKSERTLIIFHCEYSAHRAPRMALLFRSRDRQLNQHRYPALTYPDVYILDGGYSAFFSSYRERCEPQEYVEMNDEQHRQTCEREMSRLRRSSKLTRSHTYTFGTHNNNNELKLDVSPSFNSSKRSAICSSRDGRPMFQQRRMASY